MGIAFYGKHTERAGPCCPHCGEALSKPPKHGITFYADSGIVVRNGSRTKLTPSQLMILECMLDNYPRNTTEHSMHIALYGYERGGDSNVVRVFLSKMRRKLEPLGINFENEYGFGWRMTLGRKEAR